MNILVVNDDSINSVGLKLLVQAASQFGTVYVSAPFMNKVLTQLGITTKGPVCNKKGLIFPLVKKRLLLMVHRLIL